MERRKLNVLGWIGVGITLVGLTTSSAIFISDRSFQTGRTLQEINAKLLLIEYRLQNLEKTGG